MTDITEFTACDGKLYVSAVFDCFDNACLGLSIADHMRAELCTDTFRHAAELYDLHGAVSHSDRGAQYTNELFSSTLTQFDLIQSMNSAAGRCHDNAKCESMWARAKMEIKACYNTKRLTSCELTVILSRYFLSYWHNRRISSDIGGLPPAVKRGSYLEMLNDQAA